MSVLDLQKASGIHSGLNRSEKGGPGSGPRPGGGRSSDRAHDLPSEYKGQDPTKEHTKEEKRELFNAAADRAGQASSYATQNRTQGPETPKNHKEAASLHRRAETLADKTDDKSYHGSRAKEHDDYAAKYLKDNPAK